MPSQLRELDKVQETFCMHVGFTEGIAFLQHNLAPLCLRRDIAILGFLFRVCQNQVHPAFLRMFAREKDGTRYNTRLAARRHGKQLQDPCDGSQCELLQRSIFGMIRIFNLLPKSAVLKRDTKGFQKALTELARNECRAGKEDFALLFSSTRRLC